MKISVATAIIGAVDTVKTIPDQTVKFNHTVYTGPKYGTEYLSPRNQALYYKTQIHKLTDADFYIWIDGKVQITCDDFIAQCISAIQGADIAILKHHERNCIYKEVDHIYHCISKGNEYLAPRYANRPLREQAAAYKTQGYPTNAGLNDCCIFIVRGQQMNDVFAKWWYECSELDWFDQISIRFLCWFYGKKINDIVFKPGSFKDIPHVK
jgi:hypothetical protein